MGKLKKLFENKKLLVIVIIAAIFLLMIIVNAIKGNFNKDESSEEVVSEDSIEDYIDEDLSEDNYLLSIQDNLELNYGKAPEGYIWNEDGSLMSLGDKSMNAEEVVYAYFNGIKSLDISTIQKFSRDSTVVSNYSGYFDSTNKSSDYYDNFIRNMYRDCMLSMQIQEIMNTSVFAENKQVFTVKVNMLDLTSKDFWLEDKENIYSNLRIYSSDQGDSTKADIYLYDYIRQYYESGKALTRDVVFDITLQKYPDLDTGWLVSIDTDVDSACRYADGTLVVSYISEMYSDEGIDYLEELDSKAAEESSEVTEDSSKASSSSK